MEQIGTGQCVGLAGRLRAGLLVSSGFCEGSFSAGIMVGFCLKVAYKVGQSLISIISQARFGSAGLAKFS